MLPDTFKRVLAVRGVRLPMLGVTVGRLPYSGAALAVLLLISGETGSFADAGLVQGCFSIGAAVGLPVQGRIVDRIGQTAVLLVCGVVSAAALLAVALTAVSGASLSVVASLAGLAGFMTPPLGTTMRTLLSAQIPDPALRESAYTFDAVLVEVSFIVGPLLTGAVIALSSPAAGLVLNAGLMLLGALLLAASSASRSWHGGSHELGLIGPLRSAAVLVLMGIAFGFGVAVGAIELGVTALASDDGRRELAGALVSVQALGSMAGGFVYGSRTLTGPAVRRLPPIALLMLVSIVPLAFTPSLAAAFPLMLLSGIGLAPTIAIVYSLLDSVAPEGTATEATGWVAAALVLGAALGSGVAGAAVGATDAHAGLAVGVAGAALGAVVARLGVGVLAAGMRPEPASASP